MKKIIIMLGLLALGGKPVYSDQLDLQTAVSRVVSNHPSLSVSEAEVLAARAEAVQAGLWQNPVFGAEAENVFGSGNYSGGSAAEYTFSISQSFEPGGKRSKRRKAAMLRSEVAEWGVSGRRRAVEQITIRAFYTSLAAQARVALSQKQVKIAENVVESAEQRVAAGRAHRLEISRAELELADAELNQRNMQLALVTSKTMLAALWGGSGSDISSLKGYSQQVVAPPTPEMLLLKLQQHPALRRAEASIRQRQAEAGAEDAERIPAVDLGAGYRVLDGGDDQAFVLGVSIPLPFMNRNQGNREAARIRTLQAQDQLMTVRLELQQELLNRHQETQAAYTLVTGLKTRQLPVAEEAFRQATDGYEKGLFGSLDLLVAMRSLFDQEVRYINSLLKYHQALSELENMIAPGVAGSTEK